MARDIVRWGIRGRMPSRRAVLRGAAAACSAAVAGCNASGRDEAQYWTQFGYDAANTAATPARGPAEEPAPEWVHVGGAYYRNSTQVLVADSVYANTGFDGLYSLSPSDGAVRWHDPTDYKSLTPALAGGVVLPGGYGFRRVAAGGGHAVLGRRLDYRDWQTDMTAYPASPPTVADDSLVAGVGTPARGRGHLAALELGDGNTRWSVQVESSVRGAPAVADGVVYAARRAMHDPDVTAALYALDLDSGEQLWRRELGADPRFDPVDAPVAGEGFVYLSTGTGPLVAFDADSGEQVWTLDPPGGVQGSPALADGVLYAGDLDGRFHALDAGTGDVLWTRTVGKFYGGPTVAGDGIYAVTFDGTLVSWRPGGRERWRFRLDPPVAGTPVVVDGRLYLGTTEGLLYALA